MDRVPALAVVDSRNVIHQAEDVLGSRCKPTAGGVIEALSLYGYDVLFDRGNAGASVPAAGEAAFVRMCEPEHAVYGHALRNAIARLACEPSAPWVLVAGHRGQRGCLMRPALLVGPRWRYRGVGGG